MKSEQELLDLVSQIEDERKTVSFGLSEFTIEVLLDKYEKKEILVPDYQRSLVWKPDRKSRFIESLILGLPVPYLFAADVDGNLEIVDGTQRLLTVEEFHSGELELQELEVLSRLNGFRFADLPIQEQKRFKKRSLRMIELSSNADLAVRFELFSRINSGSEQLTDAEFRKGAFPSPLYKQMIELGKLPEFERICPVSDGKKKRGEQEELVLRFFAYSEQYQSFTHDVGRFLNRYLAAECTKFDNATEQQQTKFLQRRRTKFETMIQFVGEHFPYGVRRKPDDKTTPRVRFEAITVGAWLAIATNPKLVPPPVDWLESTDFVRLTRSDGSNSGPRLRERVEYVRDKLLGVQS